MKNLQISIFFVILMGFFVPSTIAGGGDSDTLYGLTPDVRSYLKSIQKGLTNDIAWDSPAAISLSTSVIATSTYSFSVRLEDDDGNLLRFFSDSVANFSVTTGGDVTAGTATATFVSSTLTFDGGSATGSLFLSGPWSIGNSIIVSFPGLGDDGVSIGALTSTTGSLTLTFTQ